MPYRNILDPKKEYVILSKKGFNHISCISITNYTKTKLCNRSVMSSSLYSDSNWESYGTLAVDLFLAPQCTEVFWVWLAFALHVGIKHNDKMMDKYDDRTGDEQVNFFVCHYTL